MKTNTPRKRASATKQFSQSIPTVVLRRMKTIARAAAKNAYVPYSDFPVGAAVLGGNGKIHAGCNVENASYGLCQCAERTAINTAVAAGERRVRCVVVFTPTKIPSAPCGACRQVINEFGARAGARMISFCDGPAQLDTTIAALLPAAFGPGNLV